ncbi:MAG TPA: hypothetical protein VGH47_00125 [Xanthobacteraceae bacterium]|jgi:hypothetical protein
MIYLSGKIVHHISHPRLGFIMTPDRRDKPPAAAALAIDNACFANPAAYSDAKYLGYLERMPRERTLFATAPDMLGDHEATVARSIPMLRAIRAAGHKAALVAQDGWDEATTPWHEFDVLFVGGSTRFKFRGGRDAVAAAKRHGKATHMGRVNSLERLRAAISIGCDSSDGTFLLFAPTENWGRMLRWFDALDRQPELHV